MTHNENKYTDKIKSLGYPEVRSIDTLDPYLIGVREGERPQWFKVSKGKLYKRMDIHAGQFIWEDVV